MSTDHPDLPVSEPSAEAPTRESPGALIREARQRLNLSLDELAGQIKLSRHMMEALERDDFGELLEPVYVRGYYRKCAKVLDIPEPRLIEAYNQRVAPKAPQPPAKLRLASGTELGSGSRLPVALALGLAVVGIVICGFFWMASDSGNTAPVTTTATIEVPAAPPVDSVPVEPEISTDPAVEGVAPEAPAAGAAAPMPAAPATGAIGTAAAPATATPAPVTAPAPAAIGGQGTVTLRFTAASWVRVDDAGGKVLLRAEFAPGESRTVRGDLPLNVHLGNGPGVTVQFQGQTVDFSSQLRSNGTARFTLPLGTP